MTALLKITLHGILPSENNYTSINVIIRQIFYNQTVNVVSVKMNKSGGRYQYVSVFYWRIKLLGKPENYPYDWYNINLNITFYWGPVDELEAGPVHLSPTVRKDWNYTANRTPSNKIQPEIVYNIHLKRSPYSRYLVNWVIASMEILLSASLLLPAHELDKRSGIYISLLLFSLGFLYKVKEYAPFTTVPTLAEATIITMDMIFIMILVATISGYVLYNRFKKQKEFLPTIIEIAFLALILGMIWEAIVNNPYLWPSLIYLIVVFYVIRVLLWAYEPIAKKLQKLATALKKENVS